jgi:nucleotide-binding universal stress UspA family protein
MKILLGIDGSRYSLAAVRFVGEYLARPGRQVQLVHVLPLRVREGAAVPRHQPESLHLPALSRSWLDRAGRRLRSRGFRVVQRVRRGVPARVLPEMVSKGNYDLVVVGAKGRADNPYLPTGSAALALIEHHVPADLLLVRERELMRERDVTTRLSQFAVMFATDGSARVARAARRFYDLFSIPELHPAAIAVTELPEAAALAAMESADRKRLIGELRIATRASARAAKPFLARPGIRPQARTVEGRPASAIMKEAQRSQARLIVLASRGARSPSGPPLGSVALQVARFAPCSVLLVRSA